VDFFRARVTRAIELGKRQKRTPPPPRTCLFFLFSFAERRPSAHDALCASTRAAGVANRESSICARHFFTKDSYPSAAASYESESSSSSSSSSKEGSFEPKSWVSSDELIAVVLASVVSCASVFSIDSSCASDTANACPRAARSVDKRDDHAETANGWWSA
jgi:hypothetical protein